MSMPREKILIVENESIVAEDVNHILQRLGYPVVGKVSTGEDALLTAEQTRPDLVLMDIMLEGDLDGIDTAAQLKNRLRIPVVYLTAYAEDSTLQRAKITEPFGFLVKPFEERELHSTIEMALYRHRMEDELRQTNTFLRSILESSSSISITSTDMDGKVLYWNSGAERLFGYSSGEVVGRENIDILYPRDEPETSIAVREMKDSVFGERKPVHREIKEVTKDGRKVWISITASPRFDDDGNVIGALGIGEDITERKQAEEDRGRLIKDLQEALANVKTLSGLLPICASCKKVRDDKGYWNQIEEYIQQHSDASFSHGICPECMEKYYGDILRKKS
jgi:PAS domain S-box-containing protein